MRAPPHDRRAFGHSLSAACGRAARSVMAVSVLVLAGLWLLTGAAAAQPADTGARASLELTPREQAWIAANPEIRMGMVADNAPYSFFRDDAFQGFSVDLARRVEDLTGLRITLRMGSWAQVYSAFRAGELEAIEAISYTEARARSILFTEPYYLRRTMVFHNLDRPLPPLDDPAVLAGTRVGVIRDIYYADDLAARGYDVVPYDSYRELVSDLAFGWIDAILAPELTGRFFARENGFSNVAVAGALPATDLVLEDFRFGVPRSLPVLRDILDKALAAIPDAELDAMVDRWRSARPGLTLTAGPLRLLPQEQAFIAERPVVRVGFMPDYWPYSYLAEGRPHGFAVDLAREIGDRAGLSIEPVFDTWPRLLEALANGDLDVLANISFTEGRARTILFTEPYHQVPLTVFVRAGFGRYTDLSDLEGLRVGVPRAVFFEAPLTARLGSEAIVPFSRKVDMMRALADGEVDAVVVALSHGLALIRRQGLMSIEVGGAFEMEGVANEDLRFGVGWDKPFLRGILDRVMASIPTARWAELESRWLGPRQAQEGMAVVPLPPEERAWLDEQGVLRVCGGAADDPYERPGEHGSYQGVAGDVVRLLSQRAGFAWELVPAESRAAALANAQEGRCDLLPFVVALPDALPGWRTTAPYLRMPAVAVTRLEHPFLRGMASLSGESVGIVGTSPLRDTLAARYPDITLVPVDSEADGLDAVQTGRLDGMIGSLPHLGYLIARQRTPDLKIAGQIPLDYDVRLAVPAELAPLVTILNRTIAALGDSQATDIMDRWMAVRFERTVDARLVWGVVLGALVLLTLVVIWNRQLHRLNAQLNRANARLRDLSVTDGLTGLPNRLYIENRMAEAFSVCQRNALPFAIAMMDVDRFKAVNDELGHAFGDACLRDLAGLMETHFRREGDSVARFGGEEFVTFSVGDSARRFPGHLEALRTRIAGHTVTHEGRTRTITMSMGCHVAAPGRDDSLSAFLAEADRNLYRAKQSGRNRVVGGGMGEETAPPERASENLTKLS
ncbi:transporter substrate-binding domain-containing diguanylate cyclase [Roseospira navarrensis]|uniref:Transporter substrate-binding domain-containing protein n=1 Tax=Roseospira navarrensis TaxID=140058 RepID=A0A7X1ZDY4_9PROT|nr:transporter substrate-binding domain-containing protein [Roseospira navarrensis]MQX35791.1 transporter substrate-binding domain-containing protein [Roseospira navarrensis]